MAVKFMDKKKSHYFASDSEKNIYEKDAFDEIFRIEQLLAKTKKDEEVMRDNIDKMLNKDITNMTKKEVNKYKKDIRKIKNKHKEAVKKIKKLETLQVYESLSKAFETQDSANISMSGEEVVRMIGKKNNYANKTKDEDLGKILDNMLSKGKFSIPTLTSNNRVKMDYADFDVNVNTSVRNMKELYFKVKDLQKNGGTLHTIDTETLGATNIHGIWQPKTITEFAHITTELSNPNAAKKQTNIVLFNGNDIENEFERIEKVLGMGKKGEDLIAADPSLRVSMQRFSLYGSDKTKLTKNAKGYWEVASIADLEKDLEGNYTNFETIKAGFEKLMAAKKDTTINNIKLSNGKDIKIGADVKEFIDSIFEVRTAMENGTGIMNGYNIKKFDIKVINSTLNKMSKDADVFNYMQEKFNTKSLSNMVINAENSLGILDMQDFVRAFVAKNGQDSLIGKDKLREIFGINPNRQEYLGSSLYKSVMEGQTAHAALADVFVADAFVTKSSDKLGVSLFTYLTKGINDDYEHGKINLDKAVFMANKGSFMHDDRNVLSFVGDRDGNIFFPSTGYSIVDGKLKHNDLFTSPSVGVKKNAIYEFAGLSTIDLKDIDNIGSILPDYSGEKLTVLKLARVQTDDSKFNTAEEYIYQVFGSTDEAIGFFNSKFTHIGNRTDDGGFSFLNKKMRDKTKLAYKSKDHYNIAGSAKTLAQKTDKEMLFDYINNMAETEVKKKASEWIFDERNSGQKAAKALDLIAELKSKNLDPLLGSTTTFSRIMFDKNLSKINPVTGEDIIETVRNTVYKYFGNEETILPSTVRNISFAMQHYYQLEEYYKNLLDVSLGSPQEKNVSYTKMYESVQNKKIFNAEFNTLRQKTTSESAMDYYIKQSNNIPKSKQGVDFNIHEKAMTKSSFARKYGMSYEELAHEYDFIIKENFFNVTSYSKVNNYNIFNQNDKLLTVNLKANDRNNIFLNNLTNIWLGDNMKPIHDEILWKDKHQAFVDFIKNIEEEYNSTGEYKELFKNKKFRKMVKDVKSGDFDLYDSVDELMNAITKTKYGSRNAEEVAKKGLGNFAAGIRRSGLTSYTTTNSTYAKALNSLDKEAIEEAMKSINIVGIPTDKKFRVNTVKDIASHYMFSESDFNDMKFATETERKIAKRLYDQFKIHMENKVDDILDAAQIGGMDVFFNNKTGEFVIEKNGKAVRPELPTLERLDNLLYLKTQNGTAIEFHNVLKFDERGQLTLSTNLEGDFVKRNSLSLDMRNAVENGDNVLDVISRKMVHSARAYKDSPYLDFSPKDFVGSNSKIDVRPADVAFFNLINDENGKKILNSLISNEKLSTNDPEGIKHLTDQMIRVRNKSGSLDTGDLGPDMRTMFLIDYIPILKEFTDKGVDGDIVREVLDQMGQSGKNTYVINGIFTLSNTYYGETSNLFDNQGRDPMVAALHPYYLRSNTIKGNMKYYENFLLDGRTIERKDILERSRRNLNIGLEDIGIDIQDSFIHSQGFLGVIGMENKITSEMDRVLNGFKFNKNLTVSNEKELLEKLYGEVADSIVGSTFEQSRLVDSRMIKAVYGEVAQDVQKMSQLKDLHGALDSMYKDARRGKNKHFDNFLDLLGDIEVDSTGNVKYTKSKGTIVKKGENIFKMANYGGESHFSSKFNMGVLNFNVRTIEGIELTEEEISKVLTKQLQEQLVGKSKEEADEIIKKSKTKAGFLKNLISDSFGKNLKVGFEIENINTSELLKIYSGGSEKGMSLRPIAKIGRIDETLASFMEDIGYGNLVGNQAVSKKALGAMITDYARKNTEEKTNKLLNTYGANTVEELIKKMTNLRDIEEDEISRLIFGEHGIFKGTISSVANDNIIGHKNMGLSISSTLSKATEQYAKYYNDNGKLTREEAYEKAMDHIIDLVNNDNKFSFLKNSKNQQKTNLKLTREGHTYTLNEFNVDLDNYSYFETNEFRNLMEQLNDDLIKKNAKKEDLLVHRNVYTKEKDGSFKLNDKLYGNFITHEQEIDGKMATVIDGAIGNTVTKFSKDSEVQSYISQEYLTASKQLYEKKSELRTAKGKRKKKLQREIEDLEEFVESQKDFSKRMKIDDQFRNILSNHKLNEESEHMFNQKFQEGKLSKEFLEEAKTFLDIDKDGNFKFKDDIRTDNVYKDWIEQARGLMTYDATKEEKLTEALLQTEEFAKYTDLYNMVTNEMGMELGVDSAKKIYDIQGAYNSFKFNEGGLDSAEFRRKLVEDYGFEKIDIRKAATTYGQNASQLDSFATKGHIVNLGRDFNNYEIAIPALGSINGDIETNQKWHQSFSALKHAYDEYYSYTGADTKVLDYLKNRVMRLADEAQEGIDAIVSKDKILGSMTKIEMSDAYHRGKLLSVSDMSSTRTFVEQINKDAIQTIDGQHKDILMNNSWMSKAKIGNKTLQEWEQGGLSDGTFFNYGVASMSDFRAMGYFDKDYMKKVGIKTEKEMIEHLETHGTMVLADRYPNIMEKSVQNVRMFLDTKSPDNAIKLAKHTMLNANGDSDGDGLSLLKLNIEGVDFAAFDINRQKAKNLVNNKSKISNFSTEQYNDLVRENTIKNLEIMFGNDKDANIKAEKVYKNFTAFEAAAFTDTLGNIDSVADSVINTMFKDEAKNYKLSGGAEAIDVNGIKNVMAQVEGGKSVLGRIRLTNLQQTPWAMGNKNAGNFLIENTKQIDSMIGNILENKDALIKNHKEFADADNYKYLHQLMKSDKPTYMSIHPNERPEFLDEILNIYEKDEKMGKNILKTSYSDAEATIINRIRADAYNSASMAKSNRGVVGQTNASLYSIRQASSEVLGYNGESYKNKVINTLGNQLEEHVISSKKKTFIPQDTRAQQLTEVIEAAKRPGSASLTDIGDKLGDWMGTYMDDSLIKSMYEESMSTHTAPKSNKITLDNLTSTYMNTENLSYEDASIKAQRNILGREFVSSTNFLQGTSEGSAIMDIYRVFGRESGRLSKINEGSLKDLNKESLTATAMQLTTGKPVGKTEMPHVIKPKMETPDISSIKPNAKFSENVVRTMSNIFDNVKIEPSGLGMGILGLATGLLIGGYASGNPLNDPKNDQIENRPQQINNMSVPDFFDKEGGFVSENPQQKGYVINLKADTKRGQRYVKKAFKQAIAASSNGAVNINMNFKSNNSGGYTDKDLEDIMKLYM